LRVKRAGDGHEVILNPHELRRRTFDVIVEHSACVEPSLRLDYVVSNSALSSLTTFVATFAK